MDNKDLGRIGSGEPTGLSSADADRAPAGLAPDGLQSHCAVKLTKLETMALLALKDGRDVFAPFGHACYSFATIAANSGIERHLVRRTVRRLARKGLAEFHKGLWNEDGEPRGAGYGLTNAGCAVLDTLPAEGQS